MVKVTPISGDGTFGKVSERRRLEHVRGDWYRVSWQGWLIVRQLLVVSHLGPGVNIVLL